MSYTLLDLFLVHAPMHAPIAPQKWRPVDWKEIFIKQSVGKCKQINF